MGTFLPQRAAARLLSATIRPSRRTPARPRRSAPSSRPCPTAAQTS